MRTNIKRRMRKSTKYVYTIVAVVFFVVSLTNLFINVSKENMQTKTEEIYVYTNEFNYDYKVQLLKNDFMKETEITDKSLAYVTDLIDIIELDFNYEYLANKATSLKYTYSIIGKMQVVYTKDGEEQKIWEEEDIIINENAFEQEEKNININEKIKLDLKGKNELLKQFKQEMGMAIEANYKVILNLNLETVVEDETIEVKYNPSIQIDLAEKTSKIKGDNNQKDTQYISKEYKINTAQNKGLIILDSIILMVSILIFRMVAKSKTTKTVRNEFRQELNRILKLCQDRIVQTSTKPSENDENIVNVKDFGEIVKVSEELFKPILYYCDDIEEVAWFSVMSSGTTYRYILRK